MDSTVLDAERQPVGGDNPIPTSQQVPTMEAPQDTVLGNALRRVAEAADLPPEETVAAFNNYA